MRQAAEVWSVGGEWGRGVARGPGGLSVGMRRRLWELGAAKWQGAPAAYPLV